MKIMKKLASVTLALVMALCLAAPAFAAENETGTITVENAAKDQTYTIYRIFDLESYNEAVKAYAYKVNEQWADFINSEAIKGVYVDVAEETGLVSWKAGAEVTEFAQLALNYAKENITPAQSDKQTASEDGEIKFTELELGYYLVDSSMGALCALNTTTPDVTVKEKNTKPTSKKEITNTDSGVGKSVEYKVTIDAKKGAEGYVIHDTMTEGLTFNNDVKVMVGETEIPTDNYIVTSDPEDGCTFEVAFTQDYLNTLTGDTTIEVIYSATINEKAVTGTDPITNKANLSYGDDNTTNTTTPTTVETKLYEFQLAKTSSADRNSEMLDGAQFALYTEAEGGEAMRLVKMADGVYRPATAQDTDTTTVIDPLNGIATIKGLGEGTYYLEETKAPDGYNQMKGRKDVKVGAAVTLGDVETAQVDVATGEGGATTTITAYVSGGVQIVNLTGAELPSTGGIGTTIFYIAGGVLAVGAGILLITKKRMGAEEE